MIIQNENVESVAQTLLASSTVLNALSINTTHQLSAQYPQTRTNNSVCRGLALQCFSFKLMRG